MTKVDKGQWRSVRFQAEKTLELQLTAPLDVNCGVKLNSQLAVLRVSCIKAQGFDNYINYVWEIFIDRNYNKPHRH